MFLLAFAGGCSRKSDQSPASSGQTVEVSELRQRIGAGFYGDEVYALCAEDYLPRFYEEFRAELFKQGVVNWDSRFDCNHFAAYYVSLAQIKFYRANWHSSTKANTLAVGVIWYVPDNSTGSHAIVAVLTEKNLRYLEPQSGKYVSLSKAEEASIFLRVF